MLMAFADLLIQIVQHGLHSLAVQAGARLVSQPPTPEAEPLSVMNKRTLIV
jgi:hypothetical protein